MAFLSQATSSWRLASSSRLPFRSMLLTPRGGPWCLAPRAHQIPVYLMVFSTFLCRAFTAHGRETLRAPGQRLPGGQNLLNSAPHFSGTKGFRQPAYASLLKEGHRLTV